jgi:RimJ/RimL family protein N-acetyltransferase
MNQFTDGVISIRPFILEDAPEHLAGEDDEQVKWLSGGKGTLDGIQGWIARAQTYWRQDGPVFTFAIVDTTGKLIGMVEANTDSARIQGIQPGDANISYGLYPFARRHGYATRAVNLVTEFIASKGVQRAVIRVHPDNARSLMVPERCGFAQQRTMLTRGGDPLVVFVKQLAR